MKKIKLTRGKFALIDDEDFNLVSKYKWHYMPGGKSTLNGYANHNIFNKKYWKENKKNISIHIKMHNLIMQPPKEMVIDHINHNGLDNRRCNLRICTMKENYHNQPKRKNNKWEYHGITKSGNKFYAQIQINGKKYWRRGFDTQKQAAIEYNKMAKKLFGNFANLNKI